MLAGTTAFAIFIGLLPCEMTGSRQVRIVARDPLAGQVRQSTDR
jgi:hypothetical protein